MPFLRSRRRSSSRRSSTRSLMPVTKTQAENNVAKKLLQLQKVVKGIAPERKYFEQTLTFTNIADTAGDKNCICLVAQGDTVGSRQGNKLRIRRIQYSVDVTASSLPANPQPDTYIRFFVVQDLQQIADTEPTVTDIFQDVSKPQRPWFNIATQGRFRILHTGQLKEIPRIASNSTPVATATSQAPTQQLNQNWSKYVNIPVTYNGTAGSDIQKNALYVVVTTNLTADTIDATGTARITYTDD